MLSVGIWAMPVRSLAGAHIARATPRPLNSKMGQCSILSGSESVHRPCFLWKQAPYLAINVTYLSQIRRNDVVAGHC